VATYFAVEKSYDEDAYVYAYNSTLYVQTSSCDSFDYVGVTRYKPYGMSQRIVRQDGIFTIHNPVTLDIESSLGKDSIIEKIIIDKSYRKELLFDLSFYGVNRLSLFPDLDGLSYHCNWHTSNRKHWKNIGNSIDFELD